MTTLSVLELLNPTVGGTVGSEIILQQDKQSIIIAAIDKVNHDFIIIITLHSNNGIQSQLFT